MPRKPKTPLAEFAEHARWVTEVVWRRVGNGKDDQRRVLGV